MIWALRAKPLGIHKEINDLVAGSHGRKKFAWMLGSIYTCPYRCPYRRPYRFHEHVPIQVSIQIHGTFAWTYAQSAWYFAQGSELYGSMVILTRRIALLVSKLLIYNGKHLSCCFYKNSPVLFLFLFFLCNFVNYYG